MHSLGEKRRKTGWGEVFCLIIPLKYLTAGGGRVPRAHLVLPTSPWF